MIMYARLRGGTIVTDDDDLIGESVYSLFFSIATSFKMYIKFIHTRGVFRAHVSEVPNKKPKRELMIDQILIKR